jgi:AraC-like DNA-binding protein
MQFSRISPPDELKNFVECYWTVTGTDSTPVLQKIIPDGFPEIIFHFGSPYKIKLGPAWEVQAENLLAGQITKYFFLENSGTPDILGIKLKPTAVTHLFQIEMSSLKNQVIPVSSSRCKTLIDLQASVRKIGPTKRMNVLNNTLLKLSEKAGLNTVIDKAVELIFKSAGVITIASVCDQCNISERQLERSFKKYIGLSPKFYARIIRFSNIFQIAQQKKLSWSDVSMESGFYDQAHFIRNFKAFTGEDPSHYFFDEPTLANFFMKKK